LDMKKFNEQFPPVEIQEFDLSHDRFMIIDDSAVYHIGASLKDLGKKWFAFSRMDFDNTLQLLMKTKN
ncbi:MAG TPA: DNA-binding protein, partial [bacterium]|nr:DNA-binding protein [bacterium]